MCRLGASDSVESERENEREGEGGDWDTSGSSAVSECAYVGWVPATVWRVRKRERERERETASDTSGSSAVRDSVCVCV